MPEARRVGAARNEADDLAARRDELVTADVLGDAFLQLHPSIVPSLVAHRHPARRARRVLGAPERAPTVQADGHLEQGPAPDPESEGEEEQSPHANTGFRVHASRRPTARSSWAPETRNGSACSTGSTFATGSSSTSAPRR